MRRKQFQQLIYDLRAELGRAVDPAAGVSDLPSLKQTIQRTYETVYDEYDWPHLTVKPARFNLNAGQRYYDLPAELSYETITDVVVWWNGQPVPLTRGIGFEEYAQYDSDNDQRSTPALLWDVVYTDNKEAIEVWPVPASTQSLQFVGKKKFVPLVDDADLCLLDDQLVVLSAAVELLPRDKKGDAQVKLSIMQARFARLKSRAKAGAASIRIGLGGGGRRQLPAKSTVRVSGG